MQGDKFTSQHGQKGTVSCLVAAEDMPFSAKDGSIPELFIDAHSMPSRMTCSMLAEMLATKACLANPFRARDCPVLSDGTAFRSDPCPYPRALQDVAADVLLANGFSPSGKEMMIDGRTGEPIQALMFQGPCMYWRLKQLSIEKLHGRTSGPKVSFTRQALSGRKSSGSGRFGEMERDVLVCHGVSALLRERLLYLADHFCVPLCNKCGSVAIYNKPYNFKFCRGCKGGDHVVLCQLPYAMLLLIRELMACGIQIRMKAANAMAQCLPKKILP
jgi:DNA-directed RNA polymerase III subunit RPC2